MEKRDIMRIYISETEECFSYDDVKKTIDRFIQKECKSKEVVIMRLNSRSNSVVTKYATEKGLQIQCLPEHRFGIFRMSDTAVKRRLVKLCDSMLLLKGVDNNLIYEIMEYGLKYHTPFLVEAL